jgi:hypothetical protein
MKTKFLILFFALILVSLLTCKLREWYYGKKKVKRPMAPSQLKATAISSSQIDLSWKDNSNNETGFKIEQSVDGVNFNQIAEVSANTTLYQVTGLDPETLYYYRVKAYNDAGDSDPSNIAKANTFVIPWARSYGGTDYDCPWYEQAIQLTSDKGYIIAGGTYSFGAGGGDSWILKLDNAGAIQWQKAYGNANSDGAYAIKQTNDGGYIVAGSTSSFDAGYGDVWIMKLDSNGEIEWQKAYGGTDIDEAYSVQQTKDGGFITVGDTRSFSAGFTDFWIIKLDSAGTIQWEKVYGGSTGYDSAYSIQQTDDEGYIVAGYTSSFDVGGGDAWIIKLGSDGTISWQKTYGGSSSDYAYSIQQTNDGGYIVAGITASFGAEDIWVIKLDNNGVIQWQKVYGGSGYEEPWSIIQTDDGGYLVTAYSNSFDTDDDAWILKLDSDGKIIWQKTYGGAGYDYATSAQKINGSGYIVAGCTDSFGAGSYDYWILKLDPDGDCFDLDSDTNVEPQDTSATVQDTSATVTNSKATVTDTTASVQDTSCQVDQQAP